jgi:hypothetical protein
MTYTLYLMQSEKDKTYTVTRCHDSIKPDLNNKHLLYSTPSFSIREDYQHINQLIKYFTARDNQNKLVTFVKRIFQKR